MPRRRASRLPRMIDPSSCRRGWPPAAEPTTHAEAICAPRLSAAVEAAGPRRTRGFKAQPRRSVSAARVRVSKRRCSVFGERRLAQPTRDSTPPGCRRTRRCTFFGDDWALWRRRTCRRRRDGEATEMRSADSDLFDGDRRGRPQALPAASRSNMLHRQMAESSDARRSRPTACSHNLRSAAVSCLSATP